MCWQNRVDYIKGEVRQFFLLAQSFYWPQTKRSLNRQFSPKSPKVGKKSGQSVKKWPNKTPLASDLLWESTKSVIGAAVGIHQIWHRTCCGNPLFGNFSIRPTVGIHQFLHRSCCGNPIINKWIPTAAPMTELVDSHSRLNAKGVLFGQFWTLWPVFWPT